MTLPPVTKKEFLPTLIRIDHSYIHDRIYLPDQPHLRPQPRRKTFWIMLQSLQERLACSQPALLYPHISAIY